LSCVCGLSFCPRTPGYWKNHPDAWPAAHLTIGSGDYLQKELLKMLSMPVRGDLDIILVKHLIAVKLNVYSGADGGPIEDVIAEADQYLANGVYNADEAENLKDIFDDFNNSGDCD